MRRTVYAMMLAVCVCTLSIVIGCGVPSGVPPSAEELATVTEEVQRPDPGERVVAALPLRSEDLVDLAAMEATLNAACPVATTCPGFDSCAAFSSTTSCGTLVCGAECARCIRLKPDLEPVCTSGVRRSTFSSRFRVCFNAQGQSCTEFQVFTASTCQTSTTGDCCSQSPDCGQPI